MKKSNTRTIITSPLAMLRLALLWLLLATVPSALAATVTWSGNGGDPNWTTPANWSPGAPAAMDILAFDSLTQLYAVNDFAADTAFGGITFLSSAGAFTLSGNSLTLAGNLQNSSIAAQTIDLSIAIPNPVTFDLAADVTVGGTISGAGSLLKLGAGSLILSNKTYSGGTTISNGLLVVNNDNGSYTVSGGALNLNYFSYWSGPTVAFNADAQVGTDASRLDFAGTMGSAGFKWTKIGSGTMNMVYWAADPTAVVKASEIRVAQGTLGSVVNGGPIAQWGSTNVPIVVSNGAALSLNDGAIAPNSSIILEGGAGTGRGALVSGQVNASANSWTNTFTGSIALGGDTTIGTFGGMLVLAGNITGTGPLTKIGIANTSSQNKLVLGGTNTYTGGTTITTGLVQLASSQALPSGPSSGNVTLGNDATLDLNGFNASVNGFTDDYQGFAGVDNSSANPATLTFGGQDQPVNVSGAVRNTGGGPLSIVKVGTAAATLSGPNTYSGSNVVMGGSLAISIPTGTSANGPVYLADGTTLTLTKTAGSSSIKASGLTLGTAGATTVNIDLGGFGSPSVPIINATNGTGIMSVGGNVTVNIAGSPNVMSAGQFPLFRYNTRAGNGSFTLGTLPNQIVATLLTNASGKSIDLLITSAPVTKWVGNINNQWDLGTTMNWTILGVPATYADGSGVEFDDSGLTNNVEVTTYVAPGGTLVNNFTKDYTFYGAGSLNGGDLIKNGSGTLTLLTSFNSYNNTVISGGTVRVGDGGPGGSLGAGNIQNDATLVYDVSEAAGIITAISGAGVLVKQNTNTLNLSGGNNYSGGTMINGGIVQMGTDSALGSPLGSTPLATVANGGSLDLMGRYPSSANPVIISGGGTGANQGALISVGASYEFWEENHGVKLVRLAADAAIGNDGGGFRIGNGDAGTGIDGRGFNLVKVGSDRVALRSTAVSAPAQIIVGGGGINIQASNPFGTGALIVLTNGGWLDSWGNNGGGATYTIANNIVVRDGGGAIRNGNGAWWGRSDYDIFTGSITLNDTLTLNHNMGQCCAATVGQLTLSGPISGAGSIIKTGPYPVTLNGTNTYTGPTIAGEGAGTVALSTASQGGGAYSFADGTTLDVPPQVGYPTLPMSSLSLGSSTGAVLVLTRVTSLSTSIALITAGNLTLVGTVPVVLPASVFTTPGQYPLIKYTGTVAGGGSFVLGGTVRGLPGSISNNVANGSIDLVVPGDKPVLWAGNAGNVWDIDTTANWQYNAASTTYQQAGAVGDAVTFTDSGLQTTVNLAAQVAPAMVIVSNASKDYTFTGTNITGLTGLLKQGTGSLSLSNGANAYTGGTYVYGGTLRISADGSVNNSGGIVTVSPGATFDMAGLNPSGITINASGSGVGGIGAIVANYSGGNQQRGPGTINMTGEPTLGGAHRWDLRNGARTLNTPTNAYTLTKVGSGQFVVNGANISPNLGDINVLAGNFTYESGTTGLGNPTNVIRVANGATLGFWQASVPLNKSIICSNGANFGVAGGNTTSLNVIAGPVQLVGGGVNINANYNNGIVFSNVISGDGGIWVQWNSDVLFSAANTFKGDIETAGRLKLVANASINPTNNVTVNNSGSGVLTVQDNAVVGGQNLRVWSGPDTGALIVKNNGTINSTTIQVGNAFADWSGRSDGMLTLQSGQTFRIDNGGRVKGNVVAATGSTFSPGGGYYIQSTGVMTNNLILQAGSTTFMDISTEGGVTTNDAVTVLGTLTYGGTLQINRIGNGYLAAGNTFKLFGFTGNPGSFAGVTADTPGQNVTWDFTQLPVDGTIRVASVFNTYSPTMVSGVSGANLVLSWPAGHTGWSLLVQTNNLAAGLSTNPADWGLVAGSTTTNAVYIPIDTAKPSEFYRMVYP